MEKDEENYFRRCVIITYRAINAFKVGYLRKLFSTDCGFWKHPAGKQYKLVLVYGTTGNNSNMTVSWGVIDGEKIQNIAWILGCMEASEINCNSINQAWISDGSKAITTAIAEVAPQSFRLACAKHWIGNHRKGSWGQGQSLFWSLTSN